MNNHLTHPTLAALRGGPDRASGFSLLEVLVALLVISFGLLGIAGMQAVSVSNTSVSGLRSIAAMQANSIASAMEANEKYWAKAVASNCTKVNGSTLATGSCTNVLTGTSSNCQTGYCSATTMAEYDLQNWGTTLAAVLPGGNGAVNCTYVVNTPITCQIMVYWSEKALAQNQQSGVAATAGATFDYEMMVQP